MITKLKCVKFPKRELLLTSKNKTKFQMHSVVISPNKSNYCLVTTYYSCYCILSLFFASVNFAFSQKVMGPAMLSKSSSAIPSIKGRNNYCSWKFVVQTYYLEHEDLCDSVLVINRLSPRQDFLPCRILLFLSWISIQKFFSVLPWTFLENWLLAVLNQEILKFFVLSWNNITCTTVLLLSAVVTNIHLNI